MTTNRKIVGPHRLGRKIMMGTAAVAAVLAGATVGPSAANATTVIDTVWHGYDVSYQANTTRLWNKPLIGGNQETPSALATDASPSMAGVDPFQFDTAFKASDNTLWFSNSAHGGHQVSIGGAPVVLPPNSGPTISTDVAGFWTIAFAQNGQVKTVTSTSPTTASTIDAIAPNTTPAIAVLPRTRGASYVVAYVKSNGHLAWRRPDGSVSEETQFTVRPGASPAIAANNSGHWLIEVADSNNREWEVSDTAAPTESLFFIAGNPAVTSLTDGSFVQAFADHANNVLWVANRPTSVSVAPGTNPSIAAADDTNPANNAGAQDSWLAVYQRPDHAVGGIGGGPSGFFAPFIESDPGVLMQPTSSPAISPDVTVESRTVTTPPALPHVKSYTVQNCDNARTDVNAFFGPTRAIWVSDLTAGGGFVNKANLQGQLIGQLCSNPATYAFTPINGHSYDVRIINLIGQAPCNVNSPSGCLVFDADFIGDPAGSTRIDVLGS